MEIKNEILKDLGKNMKMFIFGSIKPEQDPLKDLTGIVKIKKQVDIEKLLDLRGFEDAGILGL